MFLFGRQIQIGGIKSRSDEVIAAEVRFPCLLVQVGNLDLMPQSTQRDDGTILQSAVELLGLGVSKLDQNLHVTTLVKMNPTWFAGTNGVRHVYTRSIQ
jgi:hypothetical protein